MRHKTTPTIYGQHQIESLKRRTQGIEQIKRHVKRTHWRRPNRSYFSSSGHLILPFNLKHKLLSKKTIIHRSICMGVEGGGETPIGTPSPASYPCVADRPVVGGTCHAPLGKRGVGDVPPEPEATGKFISNTTIIYVFDIYGCGGEWGSMMGTPVNPPTPWC